VTVDTEKEFFINKISIVDFDNDNHVDFNDYTQFIAWWNANNIHGDIAAHPELLKAILNTPKHENNYVFTPDGRIDHEDHIAFALLYNYFNELGKDNPGKYVTVAKRVSSEITTGINWDRTDYTVGDVFTVTMNPGIVHDFLGSETVLEYDNEIIRINTVTNHMASYDTTINTPVLIKSTDGKLTASTVLLGELDKGITVLGESLFEFEFEVIAEGDFSISLSSVDLRNFSNEPIYVSIDNEVLVGKAVNSQDMNPVAFGIYQNYPNPFNPATTIEYGISKPGPVTISVYNINGQLVTTLAKDFHDAGVYSTVWDASALSGGIYICRIVSGEHTQSRKMLLIK